MPYTVLITGAGSGLGHGFVKHYLSQPDTLVIAADRTYRSDLDLEVPSPNTHTNTTLHKLTFDISSDPSIATLISSVKQILTSPGTSNSNNNDNDNVHLDLLIHSAGIRGLVPQIEAQYPDDVAAAETLHVMDTDTLMRTFAINTAGTFTLLQGLYLSGLFHPPPTSPPATHGTNEGVVATSRVILMTSRMGSISHNQKMSMGGAYAYRASKAALNAIVKSMSIDVPHVLFALVHPGRVETGLTRCREEGAIEVEESVECVVGLIGGLKLGVDETGRGSGSGNARFMDRWGGEIGW